MPFPDEAKEQDRDTRVQVRSTHGTSVRVLSRRGARINVIDDGSGDEDANK